ncbi:MAG: hypothetical protein CVU51_03030 [Deltaproteobacteria bacterium HGW-Deltaproteobacteria-1]|jgi:hypothetical protein|nr:MAG: hypothetical protein CVU51_03030 [Deltaproteobacteria bacterium HGW-Deltaproteobacteria-1]
MKNSKQSESAKKDKKTTFTMDEYDQAFRDLEFVQASLDVTTTCEEPLDAMPILYEATKKTMNLILLFKRMHPAADVPA